MSVSFEKATSIIGSDLIYERVASSFADPVNPGVQDKVLMAWVKSPTRGDALILAIGTDQHDNSYYKWVVDGVVLPISGSARAGSISEPFILPTPIRVKRSVILYITNSNGVAYPNNGLDPANIQPYECVMIGRWA